MRSALNPKLLSQVTDSTDIHELQACIYPGGHCPLFGVHFTLGNIRGVTMLVIGTADCGFYTYKTMNNFSDPGKPGAKIRCAVLDESDVINGCEEGLKQIIRRLDQDPDTQLIVVVTSCVIELTGDDIRGIVASTRCRTPVSVVKTENFKTADYLEGVEQAMVSVTHLLSPVAKIPKNFSILGPRFQGTADNRIIQRLIRDGFTLAAQFPHNTDLEAIHRIPSSSFAIVAEKTALGFARRLEADFGIPFADLSPSSDWDCIESAYAVLSGITAHDYTADLEAAKKRIKHLLSRLKPLCQGKEFIIGNTAGSPFASACLIARAGGRIKLILARNIYEHDARARQALLEMGQDPMVAKNANTAALNAFSAQLHADFHVGMGWDTARDRNGPQLISITGLFPRIGTDYPETFYDTLLAQLEKETAS